MAATSNVKLTLESQEYEKKLKRAANELANFTVGMRKAGETAKDAETRQMAFAKALGGMETSARDARGRIQELSKAFTEASLYYKRLTDAEKQTPFGKELAKSVETLKGRLGEAKSELKGVTDEIGGNSSVLKDLIAKYGSLATVLAAGKAALEVAKGALMSNEQTLDEWGRTTQSVTSTYQSFLDSLNTGDISGFLSRIGQIANAARDAYDALDALGTFNAFNQINVEKTRTGMTESVADYREGKGTKEQVRASAEAYKKELATRRKLEQEAYLAKIREVAQQRGVSAKDLTDALSGSYGNYETLKGVQMTGRKNTWVSTGIGGQGYMQTEEYAKTREEKLGQALRQLNDTELQSLQALGAQAQRTATEIAQVDKQTSRVLAGGKTTTGSAGAGQTDGKQIDLTFKTKFYTEDQYDKMLLDQIAQEHKESELRVKAMVEDAGGLAELEKMMQLGDGKTEIGLPVRNYGEKEEKKGKDKSLLDSTNQFSSGLSQVSSGLKGLGIDLGEGFDKFLGGLQAALSVINGVQTIINAFQIPSENANTAALIANTAALTSNTATNFLPFAQGGIAHAANGFIGGNYPSGDLLPIMVNSGELILNKAQQGNLASQLGGGIGGGLRLTTSISMRELRIALNSESQQRGKGKYVTTHG